LKHGDIRFRIPADDFVDLQLRPVSENHIDRVAALDDMIVCHYDAARIDDETRADRGELTGRLARLPPGAGRAEVWRIWFASALIALFALFAFQRERAFVDNSRGNGNDRIADPACDIRKGSRGLCV